MVWIQGFQSDTKIELGIKLFSLILCLIFAKVSNKNLLLFISSGKQEKTASIMIDVDFRCNGEHFMTSYRELDENILVSNEKVDAKGMT